MGATEGVLLVRVLVSVWLDWVSLPWLTAAI